VLLLVNRQVLGRSSKRRGNSLEREIAQQLSDWTGEYFKRSPTSGADHGLKNFGISADVITTWKEWPYIVECKFYNAGSWTLENVLHGNSWFPKFVSQSVREGHTEGAPFMLIFRRDYVKPFVLMPYSSKLANKLSHYMVSDIEYASEVTGGIEVIKTITFTMEELVTLDKNWFISSYDKNWENKIKKKKKNSKKVASVDNILSSIKDLGV